MFGSGAMQPQVSLRARILFQLGAIVFAALLALAVGGVRVRFAAPSADVTALAPALVLRLTPALDAPAPAAPALAPRAGLSAPAGASSSTSAPASSEPAPPRAEVQAQPPSRMLACLNPDPTLRPPDCPPDPLGPDRVARDQALWDRALTIPPKLAPEPPPRDAFYTAKDTAEVKFLAEPPCTGFCVRGGYVPPVTYDAETTCRAFGRGPCGEQPARNAAAAAAAEEE